MTLPNDKPAPDIAQSAVSATPRPLIVASNRLPISLRLDRQKIETRPSAGGLASALAGLHKDDGFQWVGWPGCAVPVAQRKDVTATLAAHDLTPVFLTAEEERSYYRGTCNQVLWPLFHYASDRMSFDIDAWEHYVEVNRKFADTIIERSPDGARVWVHDFHLMLVPGMLRRARPDLEIGFFLHIPFPSSEIYRQLPAREDLLIGVLGADYIGFHTSDYARHFRSSCLRVLGLESEPDSIVFEGRRVGIGSNPIGIDTAGFEETLADRGTTDALAELERRYEGRKIILGVERLDYTKGVPHKFQAFERFLERNPKRAQDVTLVQVLVPSRLNHPDYQRLRNEIEKMVGRINGKYGGPGRMPIEYMHRSLTPRQLVSLYRRADVSLVTPVRDGMNLVAQEMVLCQQEVDGVPSDHRGVLVLSEYAGAAQYLSRSLLVNPWDVEGTADALERALDMDPDEKRERMATMVQQVKEMDCQIWAQRFLDQLARASERTRAGQQKTLDEADLSRLAQDFAKARRRILVLDYDGTLREITRSPNEAEPTEEIRSLLRALADYPDTDVHLVSGRDRNTLEEWLGDLPLYMCAEHGYCYRQPDGEWQPLHDVDLSWMPAVKRMLSRVADEVPGTLVESKHCALAWHYRMADLDYGVWRARELRASLSEALANQPVDVVPGHRVIEVRASGVHKGAYVADLMSGVGEDTFVMCIGDDRTDMDMYRVLPPHAVSLHVGRDDAGQQYSIESPERVRSLLRALLGAGPSNREERVPTDADPATL